MKIGKKQQDLQIGWNLKNGNIYGKESICNILKIIQIFKNVGLNICIYI